MALTNYADLVSAVQTWLDDTTLAAAVPDFIKLAEAELQRRLRTEEQEIRVLLTATGEFLALPSDFGGMRAVHIPGGPDKPLEQMPQGEMLRLYAGWQSGTPRAFSITAGQLRLAPVPSSSVGIELVYYAAVPPLTVAAPVNWLMTEHPDLYLFATLTQAEFRGWNDERLPLIKARVDEIIDQIETVARKRQWGAAPVAPRTMTQQTRWARI